MTQPNNLPLSGIRVLEMGQLIAGPFAGQMLAAIKGASMLEGVRGQKGVNQDQLIEIIQRLSQLLTDLPEIQEMDLNPLIAYEDQVFVVDARISIV